ncbi:MAG: 2-amino-3,7-dideoxy-D-threo-hept-6-ulosonate synthase [Nitrososphaerota archaeon]|nr:2-amino-3,7-dideoxy-D-threo-hept-6-ulosonate synthase [Nitrososphaerota archaeon]
MVSGKRIRISRITFNDKMLCVPMDHGVTVGPIKGIEQIHKTVEKVERGGATAVLVHKGILRSLPNPLRIGVIVHLSASTNLSSNPNLKVRVGTVEEAIRLGADAVSLHINIGNKDEQEMLIKLGMTADICDEWGIPLIAMMYPRGENIKNPNDPQLIAHVARIAAELGADIVKVPMPSSDPDEINVIVRGCPVPVVAAGGPKLDDDKQVLELAYAVMKAGGYGITFGRNIFQHDDPELITKALRKIVIDGGEVEEALRILKG